MTTPLGKESRASLSLWGGQSWLPPAFQGRSAAIPAGEPPEKAAAGKIAAVYRDNLVMEMAIQQVDLAARDLGRAVEFYRDKVGLPMLSRSENTAFFDGSGVRLALVANAEAKASQTIVYFNVGDLEATVADLKTRGVAFEREPHLVAHFPAHDLWMAFFRDPDGNPLGLISERYCALGAASE